MFAENSCTTNPAEVELLNALARRAGAGQRLEDTQAAAPCARGRKRQQWSTRRMLPHQRGIDSGFQTRRRRCVRGRVGRVCVRQEPLEDIVLHALSFIPSTPELAPGSRE